jgi:hypothetical protein
MLAPAALAVIARPIGVARQMSVIVPNVPKRPIGPGAAGSGATGARRRRLSQSAARRRIPRSRRPSSNFSGE